MVIACFQPNLDFVFIYKLFCWIFMDSLFLTWYFFGALSWKYISSLPNFYWTNNPTTSKMKWHCFYCGYVQIDMKDINKSIVKNKTFLQHNFPTSFLSYIVSHNSHVLLYLNGINSCIKHLYMFWNIWNIILWRGARKYDQVVFL